MEDEQYNMLYKKNEVYGVEVRCIRIDGKNYQETTWPVKKKNTSYLIVCWCIGVQLISIVFLGGREILAVLVNMII